MTGHNDSNASFVESMYNGILAQIRVNWKISKFMLN